MHLTHAGPKHLQILLSIHILTTKTQMQIHTPFLRALGLQKRFLKPESFSSKIWKNWLTLLTNSLKHSSIDNKDTNANAHYTLATPRRFLRAMGLQKTLSKLESFLSKIWKNWQR